MGDRAVSYRERNRPNHRLRTAVELAECFFQPDVRSES